MALVCEAPCVVKGIVARAVFASVGLEKSKPFGGVREFRWGRFSGCYVTKFAPHSAQK